MKKVQWYISTSIIISVMAFAMVWMASAAISPETPRTYLTTHSNAEKVVSEPELDANIIGLSNVEYNGGITMKTTSFSSVECKTTWCRANAGLPRGNKVALNSKYGKYSKVYVPKYDRTYEVIGTTDYKTDLDFWNGDDHGAALQHGTQYLEVQLID